MITKMPYDKQTKNKIRIIVNELIDDTIKEESNNISDDVDDLVFYDGCVKELRDFKFNINYIENGGVYSYIYGRQEILEELKERLLIASI